MKTIITNTKALEANTQVYTPEQAKLIAEKSISDKKNISRDKTKTRRRIAEIEDARAARITDDLMLGWDAA